MLIQKDQFICSSAANVVVWADSFYHIYDGAFYSIFTNKIYVCGWQPGMDLLEGDGAGGSTPPTVDQTRWVAGQGCVQFFMIKQENITHIMKYTLYTTLKLVLWNAVILISDIFEWCSFVIYVNILFQSDFNSHIFSLFLFCHRLVSLSV